MHRRPIGGLTFSTAGPGGDDWYMAQAIPGSGWGGLVRSISGFREGAQGVTRRELPTGESTLIFSLSGVVSVGDPRKDRPPNAFHAFLAGPWDTYSVSHVPAHWEGVQVDLSALGAFTLFGTKMDELANGVIDLESLVGREPVLLLEERLLEETSWQERLALLDDWLWSLALLQKEVPPEIRHAWSRIEASGGMVDIGELASDLGWSHKRLLTNFRRFVGLTPKRIACVVRFDRAVRHSKRLDRPNWAEVAHDCGYTDQSHMIRDFQRFAGDSPQGLWHRTLPDGGGVHED